MSKTALNLLPIFFVPAFVVVGQVLMRLTGYTAWAAETGQEFMLSFMFYMAMLGVILGGRSLILLERLTRDTKA